MNDNLSRNIEALERDRDREKKLRRDAEWKLTQILRLHAQTCDPCRDHGEMWPCQTRKIIEEDTK